MEDKESDDKSDEADYSKAKNFFYVSQAWHIGGMIREAS